VDLLEDVIARGRNQIPPRSRSRGGQLTARKMPTAMGLEMEQLILMKSGFEVTDHVTLNGQCKSAPSMTIGRCLWPAAQEPRVHQLLRCSFGLEQLIQVAARSEQRESAEFRTRSYGDDESVRYLRRPGQPLSLGLALVSQEASNDAKKREESGQPKHLRQCHISIAFDLPSATDATARPFHSVRSSRSGRSRVTFDTSPVDAMNLAVSIRTNGLLSCSGRSTKSA
jgi:hypothetical protein